MRCSGGGPFDHRAGIGEQARSPGERCEPDPINPAQHFGAVFRRPAREIRRCDRPVRAPGESRKGSFCRVALARLPDQRVVIAPRCTSAHEETERIKLQRQVRIGEVGRCPVAECVEMRLHSIRRLFQEQAVDVEGSEKSAPRARIAPESQMLF